MSEQEKGKSAEPSIIVKQESIYGLLSKLLEKLIDKCVVTHFKSTLFAVCITVIIVAAIVYGANFSIAINLADDVFIKHIFEFIIVVVGIVCGALLMIILNKVVSIKAFIVNTSADRDQLNDIILTQFNMVRNDFSGFVTTLENFKSGNRSMSESIDMLAGMISEDIIDTKRIIHVLATVYNSIKKRPSKNTIIDMLIIRTKLITVNMIELVNEYFTLLAPSNQQENMLVFSIDGNTRAKNQFVLDKLKSMFKDIKEDYIREVYELSKNTVEYSINNEIEKILDELYERVIDYMFGNDRPATIQEIIFYIIEDVKKITIEIEQLFAHHINTEAIFDKIDEDEVEGGNK